MKLIILACALVAVVIASPIESEPVKIVRSEFEQQPEGGYVSSFEASNGIIQQETGEIKEVLDEEKKPHKVIVVRGTYSYPDPEGHPQVINYFADETGFHAEGDSIPKVPARR